MRLFASLDVSVPSYAHGGRAERVRVGEELSPVGQAFLPAAFPLAWA
jgi:hypothetical protein